MLRFLFYAVVLTLLVRALNKLWRGIVEGATGVPPASASRVPRAGVQMARDPVCGTFVVPGSAVSLSVAGEQIHFCSTACRDTFRSAPPRRTRSVEDRIA